MPRPSTLSYALNKKTDKLLKVYRKKGTGMTLMIPIGAAAGMLWVYFLGNMDRYLSTWSSLFHDGTASSELLTPLEGLFFNALMITTAAFGCVYALWNRHNEKYKKYKREILEILELDPCEHRSPCSCKDQYCYWLEQEEGVDLL
ncbi:MAG TPA: hypothetical protein GXZ29_04590 [Clostridiales bacterium]|jgi:hypothetical protein|nr:hypothetical protein [Clostridiales bacterium]